MAGMLMIGCEGNQSDLSPPLTPQTPKGSPQSTPVPSRDRVNPPGKAESPTPTIVAFGDSLTAGLGINHDQTYPAQLQRRLHQAGYDYQVVNAGVNGDTTAGGLRRVEWVLKSHPSIIILELGANDGLRGLSLDDTAANLEHMIVRFQEEGITVILAGMKIPPNYGQEYTSRFSSMYESLAKQYHLPLIPFFLDGVAAIPTLNQADGIHPTQEGYSLVVDNVLNILEPLLEQDS